ncbi:mannosyltransferase [Kappamyces sp. JEL0829]|nr:mannosyltransferase [Kappamyces sp. JEL0829]
MTNSLHPFWLVLLLLAKIPSVLWAPVLDCDEVFNYYEPLHYLLFGYGWQTWEYVGRYGLRSWAYIGLHAVPLDVGVRMLDAAAALTGSQSGVLASKAFLGNSLARNVDGTCAIIYMLISALAPGFFIASSSFLPSTFGMICITFAHGLSLEQHSTRKTTWSIILWTCLAGIWGWPFCLAYGGIYIVQRFAIQPAKGRLATGQFFRHLADMVVGGMLSIVSTVLPLYLIDSVFYGKPTLAPLNLLVYNVFSDDSRGPDLYGVEPWHFYLANGILNFNIAFVLALASVPATLLAATVSRRMGIAVLGTYRLSWDLAPFYIWLGIFTFQPHKEERFMFVVFPMLAANAAIGLRGMTQMLQICLLQIKPARKQFLAISKAVLFIVLASFAFLSLARSFALHQFYHAPILIYQELETAPPPRLGKPWNTTQTRPPILLGREMTVCVAKEWYRFPSHFNTPHGMRLQFVESHFRGLLPTYFDEVDRSSYGPLDGSISLQEYARSQQMGRRSYQSSPRRINDLNQHEPDRYCDYLVDSMPREAALDAEDPVQPFYGLHPEWKQVTCRPFLDASRTRFPARAFYFGGQLVWQDYCLYVRN